MYFDMHSDIWTDVTARRLRGETNVLKKYHLDRLRKGNVEGSIFVIWVDPPYDTDYVKRTEEIMRCAKAEAEECSEVRIVRNYSEMMKAREDGKFYIFCGVEGMAAIGRDVSKIDMYYDFGCRHAMLTWNEVNDLGAGANSGDVSGLTDIGKKAARTIQKKGMILDTSHLNEAGFWDIVKLAEAPIMASHSNCKAMCGAPRNLTDDQLRAIRDLDGIVGLNSFKQFVSDDPALQTVETLARHAEHMIDIMGIDHVVCGFDFFEFCSDDAMNAMNNTGTPAVAGMADSSEIPNLFGIFKKMGMSKDEMEKIAFRNAHRFIKKVLK